MSEKDGRGTLGPGPAIRADVASWLDELALDGIASAGALFGGGHVAGFCDLLSEMHALAKERDVPIIGPQVGRLLAQLAAINRPKRIFELGSGFGYSALWMAWALADCTIICTDGDSENQKHAQRFFERGQVADRIELVVGDAMKALEATSGQFDLIFCDVDKHQYPAAYDAFADRVAPGGLAIIDNLVWSGRVAAGDDDADTNGVREYIARMWGDQRFLSSLMPVRDGVGISIRFK
jgi:caffeoyl-CoA O-methyltransferase